MVTYWQRVKVWLCWALNGEHCLQYRERFYVDPLSFESCFSSAWLSR